MIDVTDHVGGSDGATTRHSKPVDGSRLAHDELGSGKPVVLLHGWPGHCGDYAWVVPLLAAGRG